MRKLLLIVSLLLTAWVGIGYAECFTSTITTASGRTMTCKTCCEEGSTCHTTCF